MEKYRLLREWVTDAGIVPPDWLRVPEGASDGVLALAHAPAYVAAVTAGRLPPAAQRRIGFRWSPGMVERSRRSVGGTIAACRAALLHGTGVNLAGGTHHAFADRGEGYCVFNDIAVAVRLLQADREIERALVVDCDVHQGNGTAAIFRGDPSVFTLDLFAERNFPFDKEPCDLAVPLRDGMEDAEYLSELRPALEEALGRSRPDLACYVAGADPYTGDRLGRLSLTKAGLRARDRLVLDTLQSAGVPVAVVMGGGYAADIRDTVEIQGETVREALRDGR
jgi:acetoin utilization deacetylase AcuC-like enzyme